jgi:hypothetical protein
MVTRPRSTMSGTRRSPPESSRKRAIAAASFFTSWYSTGTPLAPNSSRAADVYGQVSLPKMSTGSAIARSLRPNIILPPTRPCMDFLPARGAGARPCGPFAAGSATASPLLDTARNAAAFTSREWPMTAARRRVVWKILVAALVGIPWIPIAAALYAWIG